LEKYQEYKGKNITDVNKKKAVCSS